MTYPITRQFGPNAKGSELTFADMDNNLLYLDAKVTGSNNYIALFNGSSAVTSSIIYQLNNNIGIGTTNPLSKFVVSNNNSQSIEFDYSVDLGGNYIESFNRTTNVPVDLIYYLGTGNASYKWYTNGSQKMSLNNNGSLNITGSITSSNGLLVNNGGITVGGQSNFDGGIDLFESVLNLSGEGGLININNGELRVTGSTNITGSLNINGSSIITGSLNVSGSTIVVTGSLRIFSPVSTHEIRGNNSINLISTGGAINLTATSGVNINGNLNGGIIYSNDKVRIGSSATPSRQLEITNSGSLSPTIRFNNIITGTIYDISNTGNLFINRGGSNSGLVIASGSGAGGVVFTTSSITLQSGGEETYTTTNFGAGVYTITLNWNGGDDITIYDGSTTGSIIWNQGYATPPVTSSTVVTISTGFLTFKTDGFTQSDVDLNLITVSSLASNIRVGINKASGSAINATGLDISGSLLVSGSNTITDVLTLPPVNPLPSGRPTGSLAVSGSGANCKIYFFNGSWNALF